MKAAVSILFSSIEGYGQAGDTRSQQALASGGGHQSTQGSLCLGGDSSHR